VIGGRPPARTPVFPLDDRSALQLFRTARPQFYPPRNRYIYYPDVADAPSRKP